MVTLRNPLSISTEVTVNCSNSQNYRVLGGGGGGYCSKLDLAAIMLQARPETIGAVTLAPNESVDFHILFWPSSVANATATATATAIVDTSAAMVEFRSADLGSVKYQVQGWGVWPSSASTTSAGGSSRSTSTIARKDIRMPETVIRGTKGKTSSGTIVFTNPFAEAIFVSPVLRGGDKYQSGVTTRKSAYLNTTGNTTGSTTAKDDDKEQHPVPTFQLVVAQTMHLRKSHVGSGVGGGPMTAMAGELSAAKTTMSTATAGLLGAATTTTTSTTSSSTTIRMSVPAFDRLELPFTFHPTLMDSQAVELAVDCPLSNVRWIYPIVGVTEMLVQHNVHTTVLGTTMAHGSSAYLKDGGNGGNGGNSGSGSGRTTPRSLSRTTGKTTTHHHPKSLNVGGAGGGAGATLVAASYVETRIGETVHVQLDVPLLSFLSARKHAGCMAEAAISSSSLQSSHSRGGGDETSNTTTTTKYRPLQVHVEYHTATTIATTTTGHPGNSSSSSPTHSLGNLHAASATAAAASTMTTESLSNLLGDEGFLKVTFQSLVFPPGMPQALGGGTSGGASNGAEQQHTSTSPTEVSASNGSTTTNAHTVIGRCRARFEPKRSVDLVVHVVITDEVTKVRWKVPLRLRSTG